MDQIRSFADTEDIEFCRRILSSVTLAYRPTHPKELVTTAILRGEPDELQPLNELVDLCSSFLTVREGIIYFVQCTTLALATMRAAG